MGLARAGGPRSMQQLQLQLRTSCCSYSVRRGLFFRYTADACAFAHLELLHGMGGRASIGISIFFLLLT